MTETPRPSRGKTLAQTVLCPVHLTLQENFGAFTKKQDCIVLVGTMAIRNAPRIDGKGSRIDDRRFVAGGMWANGITGLKSPVFTAGLPGLIWRCVRTAGIQGRLWTMFRRCVWPAIWTLRRSERLAGSFCCTRVVTIATPFWGKSRWPHSRKGLGICGSGTGRKSATGHGPMANLPNWGLGCGRISRGARRAMPNSLQSCAAWSRRFSR